MCKNANINHIHSLFGWGEVWVCVESLYHLHSEMCKVISSLWHHDVYFTKNPKSLEITNVQTIWLASEPYYAISKMIANFFWHSPHGHTTPTIGWGKSISPFVERKERQRKSCVDCFNHNTPYNKHLRSQTTYGVSTDLLENSVLQIFSRKSIVRDKTFDFDFSSVYWQYLCVCCFRSGCVVDTNWTLMGWERKRGYVNSTFFCNLII